MWISLDDIETSELTYKSSQLSLMTRPHTQSMPRCHRTVSQVKRGPDGLHHAQMDHILKENLNLLGAFFQIWVVCQSNVLWGCRKAPTVGKPWWADIKGVGHPIWKWPTQSSLAQSVTLSIPSPPRSQPPCHKSASDCPRGRALRHSHSQHPRLPVQVTLWHLLDRTERDVTGICDWMWTSDTVTLWPL